MSRQTDSKSVDPKTEPTSNAVKDPHTWTTGDEPMTGAQASYLKTLSEEAGEEMDDSLNKAEASMKIDELRQDNERVSETKPHSKA